MKTEFLFESTRFNCTEPKDYFINEGCFGDDVALWLIERLQKQGVETAAKPDQEDFGWYFTFFVSGTEHCVVITFQPVDPAAGIQSRCWVERHTGFLGYIFGGRNRGILGEAISEIDTALESSPDIQRLVWQERGMSKIPLLEEQ
jgi:hypothetical protein